MMIKTTKTYKDPKLTIHKIQIKIGIFMLLLKEVKVVEKVMARARAMGNVGTAASGGIHGGNAHSCKERTPQRETSRH